MLDDFKRTFEKNRCLSLCSGCLIFRCLVNTGSFIFSLIVIAHYVLKTMIVSFGSGPKAIFQIEFSIVLRVLSSLTWWVGCWRLSDNVANWVFVPEWFSRAIFLLFSCVYMINIILIPRSFAGTFKSHFSIWRGLFYWKRCNSLNQRPINCRRI